MSDVLESLLQRTAGWSPEDSMDVWRELLSNIMKWTLFDGRVNPKLVKDCAATFVAHHAYTETNLDVIYSPEPIKIFRYNLEDIKVEGLLYGNGAVGRVTKGLDSDNPVHTYMLWIDADTINLFGYSDRLEELSSN